MNAEIIAVGTELLMGQIANTNAQYISRRLQDIGVNVFYHSVVGDSPHRLRTCLDAALQRSDVVILTGGLGPTQDDLTKETVAQAIEVKLVLHEPSLQKMKDFFAKLGISMEDNNIKQAFLPEGSIVMNNSRGTAPGCITEKNGRILAMLPGPPSEMKPMFEENIIPYLEARSEDIIVSTYINVCGVSESLMEEKLLDLIQGQTNPSVATYANGGEVTIRLTSKYKKNTQQDVNTPVAREIIRRFGNAVYSTGKKSLAEVVAGQLLQANLSLAIADHYTGGLIFAALTKIPDVPRIYYQGTLSPAEQNLSSQTAIKMAKEIRDSYQADFGLAVTGSPDPDLAGTVYIALASAKRNDNVRLMEFKPVGDLERSKTFAVLRSLDTVRHYFLAD